MCTCTCGVTGSDDEREQLVFRDWLRVNADDRARYESVKRELAARKLGVDGRLRRRQVRRRRRDHAPCGGLEATFGLITLKVVGFGSGPATKLEPIAQGIDGPSALGGAVGVFGVVDRVLTVQSDLQPDT